MYLLGSLPLYVCAYIYIYIYIEREREREWRSWLRHYTTSRKVAGSIPDGVIGVFH